MATLEELRASKCGTAASLANEELAAVLNELDQARNKRSGKPAPKNKFAATLDALYEANVNGMLSHYGTHLANMVSTAAPIPIRPLETLTSAVVSKIFRDNPQEAVYFTEALAEASGIAEGVWDAMRFLGKRLNARNLSANNAELMQQLGFSEVLADRLTTQSKIEHQHRAISGEAFQAEGYIGAAIDLIGTGYNLPGMALTTEDLVFKVINARAQAAKDGMRTALAKGGSAAEITAEYNRYKQDVIATEKEKVGLEKVALNADDMTYTRRPHYKLAQWMVESGHAAPYLRWIVPFRRTTINIVNFSFERSPLALAMPHVWKELKKGGARRSEAIGRMLAGTGILAAIYGIADHWLTGKAPESPDSRDLWYKDGYEEFTLRTPAGNIPFDALGGLGPTLKVIALTRQGLSNIDYENDPDADNIAMAIAGTALEAIVKSTYDNHWIYQIATFTDAVDEAARYGNLDKLLKFAARTGVNLMPLSMGVTKSVTRNLDNEVKDARTPMDVALSRIPFLSSQVTPKVDFWGNIKTYDNWQTPEYEDPTSGQDPVSVEMRKVGVEISKVPRKQFEVDLTPEEYMWLRIYAGREIPEYGLKSMRDTLKDAMNSSSYSRFVHEKGKAGYLERIIMKRRKAAKMLLFRDPRFNFRNRVIDYNKEQAEINRRK